jgi:hypothetical protein
MAIEKDRTKKISPPLFFLLESGIRDPGWEKKKSGSGIPDPQHWWDLRLIYSFLFLSYLNTLRVSVMIMSDTAVQSEVDHYMGGKRSWSYSHPPRPDRVFNPIGIWGASGTRDPTTGNHVSFNYSYPYKLRWIVTKIEVPQLLCTNRYMLQFCNILGDVLNRNRWENASKSKGKKPEHWETVVI